MKCHVAALPVPYRTTAAQPSFMSLTDPCCGDARAFPVGLDPFVCTRQEIFDFGREAYALGIHYLGVCCGAGPHHIRALAESLGRKPPASRYYGGHVAARLLRQHRAHQEDPDRLPRQALKRRTRAVLSPSPAARGAHGASAAGRPSGARPEPKSRLRRRHRRRRAATGSRPPTTWRRITGSATWRCSSAAGSAAATPGATPPSCAPTISFRRARASTTSRCGSTRGSSRELNFNIMLSQRGLVLLAHSRHDLDAMSRWANAMRMNGIDAEILSRAAGRPRRRPLLEMSPAGALSGPRRLHAAARRHRAPRRGRLGLRARRRCARRGHHPELRGDRFHARMPPGASPASRPAAAASRAERIGIAAAGHSSVLAKLAGFRCRSRATRCRRW